MFISWSYFILALFVFLAGILAFSVALIFPVLLFHRRRARHEQQQRGFEVKANPHRANRTKHSDPSSDP